MELGEPNDFLRVGSFTLNNRGNLTVASACIKADAAAIKMATYGSSGFLVNGSLLKRNVNNLERSFVNAGHKVTVEIAVAAYRVVSLDLVSDNLGAGNDDLIAAAGPEQSLYKTLNKLVVFFVVTGAILKYVNGVNGGKTVISFQTNGQLLTAFFGNCFFKFAIYNSHRHKAGVERSIHFKLHKWFFLS